MIETKKKITFSFELKILNKSVSCYIYDVDKKAKFMNWWKKNKWFYNNEEKSIKKKQKILWDFDKKTRHWKHYCEEAITIEETFKIICLRCFIVLIHFSTNVENTIMINHLIFAKCKKIFKFKELNRISNAVEYRVSIKELS